MPTSAERTRRVTAAQKRLTKAQADKATLTGKIEALDQEIRDEIANIEWLEAMPVTDAPAPTAGTAIPAPTDDSWIEMEDPEHPKPLTGD